MKVPKAYGALTHTSGFETSTVLWFTDKDGVIRNVIVGHGGGGLYQVVLEE